MEDGGGCGLVHPQPHRAACSGRMEHGTPSEERMAGIGVIVLLLFVALGLLLILPAAIRLEAFEYLEKEQIALAYGVEASWSGRNRSMRPPTAAA